MLQGFVEQVLTSAAISTVLVATLAFLGRSWISERIKNAIKHEYDQKLETHKAQLKAQGEVEIERLRSHLSISAAERNVVFTRLHEKRANVIAQTYEHLTTLHIALGDYIKIFEPAGDKPKEERRTATVNAHKAFVEYYPHNRIFLPRKCVQMIDVINTSVIEVYNSFYFEVELRASGGGDARKWLQLFERVKGEMREALDGLEDEFRFILGDEGEKGAEMVLASSSATAPSAPSLGN